MRPQTCLLSQCTSSIRECLFCPGRFLLSFSLPRHESPPCIIRIRQKTIRYTFGLSESGNIQPPDVISFPGKFPDKAVVLIVNVKYMRRVRNTMYQLYVLFWSRAFCGNPVQVKVNPVSFQSIFRINIFCFSLPVWLMNRCAFMASRR